MIQPTVGRVVWFFTAGSTQEQAATIASVNEDGTVNLSVLSPDGHASAQQNVFLAQEPTPGAWAERNHCEWMPYQKGQADKTEESEKRVAELTKTTEPAKA